MHNIFTCRRKAAGDYIMIIVRYYGYNKFCGRKSCKIAVSGAVIRL